MGGRPRSAPGGVTPVEYLDLDDLLALIRDLRIGPVRDIGLLDSAAGRPRSRAFGEDAYATLPMKAAALLHSLARNHALMDGNKRLAWLATTVFLDLTGHAPDLPDVDAFQLVLDVAQGVINVDEIAERLRVSAAGRRSMPGPLPPPGPCPGHRSTTRSGRP